MVEDDVTAGENVQTVRTSAFPLALLAFFFIASQALALVLAPTFADAGVIVFDDPENVGNTGQIIFAVLFFTALILVIARLGRDRLIQAIILASVGITIWYVVGPLLLLITPYGDVIGMALAAVLTFILYKFPEWYVIDTMGILMAAGITTIFGISLGIVPAVALLIILAAYDFISVYRTKHMIALADNVMDLRLPLMFIAPKKLPYSFLEKPPAIQETIDSGEEREAYFLGIGDIVIPTMLAISALTFLETNGLRVALGAMTGTLIGFAVLMYFVTKGRPHAGLPLLNGGTIIGFAIAYLAFIGL